MNWILNLIKKKMDNKVIDFCLNWIREILFALMNGLIYKLFLFNNSWLGFWSIIASIINDILKKASYITIYLLCTNFYCYYRMYNIILLYKIQCVVHQCSFSNTYSFCFKICFSIIFFLFDKQNTFISCSLYKVN